jgi:hypothetical protein
MPNPQPGMQYQQPGMQYPQPGMQYQQPGMQYQQPGMQYQQPTGQPQPAGPTAATGQPGGGPPPGYRPVGGSATPAPAGGAGQVMYFHKPADALAVDSGADPGAVALAAAPPAVAPSVADVPVGVPGYAPPPLPYTVTDRPIGAAPPLPLAIPAPVIQQPAAQPAPAAPTTQQPATQPDSSAAQPPVQPFLPAEVTQVPPREKIFLMYDDVTLQRLIIERAKEDARRRAVTDKKEVPKLEGNWDFPTLTPVVPSGTPFVGRTGSFPPVRGLYEPGFVVHRRLHFEEQNSERYGWDLGFMSPIVSAAYFYRDVLLWPNSLATGAVIGFWDTSAGKCLPGSPTPYYLYPPGLSITGLAAEGLIITGISFIIP